MDEQKLETLLEELKDLEKYHLSAQIKLEERKKMAKVLIKDLEVQGLDPNNLEEEGNKLQSKLDELELEFKALKEKLETRLKESNLWS